MRSQDPLGVDIVGHVNFSTQTFQCKKAKSKSKELSGRTLSFLSSALKRVEP